MCCDAWIQLLAKTNGILTVNRHILFHSLTDLPKHEVLDMTARLYLNLGITYECKEEFSEAIKYFEKAMSICRHNDFWELLHKCYLDAALLYFNKLDDHTKALQLLNLAINIAERLTTDRTVRVCQTLLSKSEVLIKMADFQGAKQILHKAYKMKTPDEGDAESIETNLKIGENHKNALKLKGLIFICSMF